MRVVGVVGLGVPGWQEVWSGSLGGERRGSAGGGLGKREHRSLSCLFSPGRECDRQSKAPRAWSPRQAAPVSLHLVCFLQGVGSGLYHKPGSQAGWSGQPSSFALVPPFSALTRQTDTAPD